MTDDRPVSDGPDRPNPSARGIEPVRDLVLHRLEAQCAVVQVVARRPLGQWQELHRGGTFEGNGAGALPPPGGDPVPLLNWLAAADAARIGTALAQVAESGDSWRGQAHLHGAGADSARVAVRIDAQTTQATGSCCILVARAIERSDDDHAQVRADAFSERVRLAESAAAFGIIDFSAGAQTVHLDAAAAALHGLAAEVDASISLDDWAALFAQEDQLRAHTLLRMSLPAGETQRMTLRLPVADAKQPRLIELSLRAAPDKPRLVGACRDVTRERSVEALRRQKLTAERASRAKTEFMSHVSHELRTPLNAILGFAQLMAMDQADPLSKAHHDRLEMVQHSGKRLLGLIDQLLQITKIERGKTNLHPKPVNVNAVVRHCVEALDITARERGIQVTVDIERPEWSAVHADPDALEQVLVNLLSNAIKYNRDQGRVRISFRAAEIGEILVDDTGKGLSESQLGRMFEPFDRLDADTSAIPGTGLGLVITKQLIEAMGGNLNVLSEVGKGSRFRVELPLAPGLRDTGTTSFPLDFPSMWDTGREYSVLYIEDDDVNVVLMEQLFASQPDWRLTCVSTGVDGITAAVQQHPDLILLDMNLPDMEGAEVFKRLQSDPRTRGIRCVAVSADAMPANIRRVHELGFQDYWTKPLDLPAVIAKLKRLLL